MKRVLSDKPDKIKNDDFVNQLYAKIAADPNPRPIRRSIQLSDLHIDFEYQEGSPVDCNFPICCRDNGPEMVAAKNSKPAGYWGDYGCDIPERTIQNMFKFIAANQDTLKTEFITWVGDNSAHNVWSNTNEEVTKYTTDLTNDLKNALASHEIEFYPSLGNHDTWPVNVENFDKPYSNYPINHLKDTWTDTHWLSEDEQAVFA